MLNNTTKHFLVWFKQLTFTYNLKFTIMETKKINDRFSFENCYVSTRSGFKHTSVLYDGFKSIGLATCHYLNRTWERYPFQSSMQQAIHNTIEREKTDILDLFKKQSGKTRLKQTEKDSLFLQSDRIKELNELKNLL